MYEAGISRRARNELASLNRIFLELLTKSAKPDSSPADCGMGLSADLLRRISVLDSDSFDHIASCPFSLCSYGFHDLEAWHALLRKQVRELDPISSVVSGNNTRMQFVIMSLTVVRELAANETHAAALFFGMPRELGESFAQLDLAQLPFVASSAITKMHVRLARNPRFWTELIGASADHSTLRLGVARALGVQLTLQRALQLTGCRLGGGRLYRRL